MSESQDRYDNEWSGALMSQCYYCRRRRPVQVCAAFPGGIPDIILRNEMDHRRPIDGDHGVRFAPRDDADPGSLASLYKRLDGAS